MEVNSLWDIGWTLCQRDIDSSSTNDAWILVVDP